MQSSADLHNIAMDYCDRAAESMKKGKLSQSRTMYTRAWWMELAALSLVKTEPSLSILQKSVKSLEQTILEITFKLLMNGVTVNE